ncbi:MAG: hypothetical protein ACLPM8_12180, partial [Myxococcaceae bacterium]
MTDRLAGCFVLLGVLLVSVACPSSTQTGPSGGFAAGSSNDHCVASVYLDAGNVLQADAGQYIDDSGNVVQLTGVCDMGPTDSGSTEPAEYGDTNFGTEAADDDCKYNVSVSVTPVYENSNATFTVIATNRWD